MMELNEKLNLILRITEYGLNHNRFVYNVMATDLKLKSEDEVFVYGLLSVGQQTDNPNHLMICVQENTFTRNWRDYTYSIVPTAFYNYVDYLEIKQARQQATDAKYQSSLALMVAVGSLVIGSFIGLLGILVQLLLTK